ncbi:MAG TPA: CHASE3 domain-containing protein, partial [Bryobacteraceae bacterium]|nr:CHASE3 domain-containing protein [Bryobacteraceae bacterium]
MFDAWSFQKRVNAGFGVMVAMVFLTTTIAVYALRAVAHVKDAVISVNAQNLIDAARLDTAINEQIAGFRGFIASPESSYKVEVEKGQREFTTLLPQLKGRVYTPEGKQLSDDIASAHALWLASKSRAMEVRSEKHGLDLALRIMREQTLPLRAQVVEKIDAFVAREQRLLQEANARSAAEAR